MCLRKLKRGVLVSTSSHATLGYCNLGSMGNEGSKSKAGSSTGISLGLKSGPSNAAVQRHIDTAKKSRVLQLRNTGLKKVPDSLQELSDILRNLELSSNKLKAIPTYIGDFASLKQLRLADNLIEVLADEVGCLKNLEVLDLGSNKLSELPSSLAACSSLKTLNLSGNAFSEFPVVTCHLFALEMMDLSKNTITTLPDEIATCRAAEINLNQNRVSFINAEALLKCERLKILRLEENCLEKSQFTQELLEDSTLAIIAYSGNLFQDKEFQDLNGYEKYQDRYTATKRKM